MTENHNIKYFGIMVQDQGELEFVYKKNLGKKVVLNSMVSLNYFARRKINQRPSKSGSRYIR